MLGWHTNLSYEVGYSPQIRLVAVDLYLVLLPYHPESKITHVKPLLMVHSNFILLLLTLNCPPAPGGGGGLWRIGRSSSATRGGGGMAVFKTISIKLDALMTGPK
jgi:hypothetical protein